MVSEPQYLVELEYSSQPEIERHTDEVEVEIERAEKEVEGEVCEVEVQAVSEAEVQAVGEVEVEGVCHVEPKVEAKVEVEAAIEVEVEALTDVDKVVEDEVEVEVEAVADVEEVVEDEVEVHVEAVADVDKVVEGEVEVEVEVVADVEGDVQVQVEGVAEVEGNDVEGQEDVLNDDEDEVECDIFEPINQVENGGPRGLYKSDWESESLNSIVESDNTDDDRDGYGGFENFSMPKSMEQYKWEVGTYFPNKKDFTKAIRTYGVENGRKLKVYKNDKRRVCVRCSSAKGKCSWYAYCAYKASENTWQLRKIIDKHTCSREFNIRLMTSKWLSGRLEKSIKENPNINLYNLQSKVSKKWNIGVPRSTTCRAKGMAFKQIEVDFKEQYRRLYDYANELLRANPSSTIKLKVEPNEDNRIFKRMYVCLKGCKDSFVSCRPIIGVDGCFLKGKYGGELLTAVARDGNEQMCPLAYAVVEVENKDSWQWFLELLIDDLGGQELCSTITYISDQQKGLVPTLQELLPGVENKFCVRHIYANFRKKFPGHILRRLLCKAASSTHPQAGETVMREIKDVNPDAFKHLLAIPPRFTGNAVCDTLVNNMSEAFNSVIVHARGKPIITMMEDIRIYIMKRWATNRQKITTFEGCLCPKVKKRFEKELHMTKFWIPSWSGIPCCHALAAMNVLNINGEDYVSNWFRRATYQETYIPMIYPVNGHHLWEMTSHPDVLPPPKRVLPGPSQQPGSQPTIRPSQEQESQPTIGPSQQPPSQPTTPGL
ncbi:uncharacterized protein LOC108336910 [Vigna angularis]|uniref:uncharacterized protein LOC108336910 n=1 Tax=Phaseolus angularis TaxID=3914 RepID=UPI0022B5D918|nr:uncharacterized protein LOC108336910 [Vigna angularis]